MLTSLQTPFFLLDKSILLSEIASLKSAINQYWPRTIIAYSLKTNSLPYLAKLMNEKGVFAEVVSEDEFDMASMCGYSFDRIVCNGPVKSESFVSRLMENSVLQNIDSHAELQYVLSHASKYQNRRFGVGVRVNIDIEKYFPTESKAGEKGSRFGFCMENEELGKALKAIECSRNVFVKGLHLHVSTSTRKVEIYQWLSQLFATIVNKFDLREVEYFDIGGGFFGGMPDKPGWCDYLSVISKELEDKGFDKSKLELIIEPGVSLLAGAFSYYCSVVDVKQTNRSRFVVTDGSRIHIDPFFHKTKYFYNCIQRNPVEIRNNTIPSQVVVGFTCLEYDDIMTIEGEKEAVVGDLYRFDKLGAYTISLSPLFISYFPAVYVQNQDGTYECVRGKWGAREFMQLSNL